MDIQPYLVCVSRHISPRSVKEVLDPIPYTQHRPIAITISSVLKAVTMPFQRRFNLGYLSKSTTSPNNYHNFIDLVKKSARLRIPRGCRTKYIASLSEASNELLNTYQAEFQNDPFSHQIIELGETLLEEVGEE